MALVVRSLIAGGLSTPFRGRLCRRHGSFRGCPSRLAGWRRMMAFSGVTSRREERGFRRSAGTNFEIAIAVVPARMKRFSPLPKMTGRWVNYAFSLPHWNSVPSTQVQCRTTASLRATAVMALLMPTRLESATVPILPDSHDEQDARGLEQIEPGRAVSSFRDASRSIQFTGLVTTWCSPRQAPTSLELLKWFGSSIVLRNARGAAGPTPGTVKIRIIDPALPPALVG